MPQMQTRQISWICEWRLQQEMPQQPVTLEKPHTGHKPSHVCGQLLLAPAVLLIWSIGKRTCLYSSCSFFTPKQPLRFDSFIVCHHHIFLVLSLFFLWFLKVFRPVENNGIPGPSPHPQLPLAANVSPSPWRMWCLRQKYHVKYPVFHISGDDFPY